MKQSKILGLGTIALAAVLMTACGGESPSGQTDCDPACGENQECKDGQCVEKGGTPSTECDPACTENQECKEGKCVDKGNNPPTGECDPACGENQECQNGTCVDKGNNPPVNECNPACGENQTCENGTCVDNVIETTCAVTETKCGDECIDTNTNKDHCGNCDTKCEGDLVCNNGNCVKECAQGEEACGDTCANIMTDNTHCGACNHPCDVNGGESCQAGECKKSCTAGTELCGTECLDLDSDAYCGTCDNHKACASDKGEACVNRECKSICLDNQTFCGSGCVDLKADKNNCGECGHACNEGEKCNGGTCGQDCGDLVDCNGNCIDPKTSNEFCGANDTCSEFSACGDGFSCQNGECACANTGDSVCSIGDTLICTDPQTNATYCGCNDRAAGVNCDALPGTASSGCQGGTCKFECDTTHADCDSDASTGCEADLLSVDNCGACGNKCEDPNAKSASCNTEGKCEFECNDNMKTCDNKCTAVLEDDNNCGWCGNKCNSDSKCMNGFCVVQSECDDEGYISTKIENASGNLVDVKAYCIYTDKQFMAMRNRINDSSLALANRKYPDTKNTQNAYILMAPIDLGTQEWASIGLADSQYFQGYFLGNGQKISGKITLPKSKNPNYHSIGLFGDVVSSTITGMNLDLDITDSEHSENISLLVGRSRGNTSLIHNKIKGTLTTNAAMDAGLVVGSIQGNTVIRRLETSGTLKAGGRSGGLAGVCEGSTAIISDADIDVTLNISSNSYKYGSGGLIGYIANQTTIENTTTTGTISDSGVSISGMGGLIGRTDAKTVVSKTSSSVKLNAQSSTYIGGLIGVENNVLTISESSASGTVDCLRSCGGLLGSAESQCVTIDHCYATGNVNSKSPSVDVSSGGLVGYIGTCGSVANSYATGDVTDTTAGRLGGLVGYVGGSVVLQNVYASGNVKSGSDSSRVGGLIGQVTGNPKFIQVYATGSVKGGSRVGGLIGDLAGGQLSYCAATGNVENVSSLIKEGEIAGGLIGSIGSATVVNCMALGDTTGKTAIGSVVGLAEGATTIRNVYGAGKATGNSFTGAFVGKYSGASGQSLVMRKSYYWEESAASDIGAGSATPTEPSLFPFKYNEAKEAVPSLSPNSKLYKQLGDSDWIQVPCKLESGVKDEVSIPVLKVLSNDLCK